MTAAAPSLELLPCPFCAFVPTIANIRADMNQGDKWGSVVCDCGIVGPEVRTGYAPVADWADRAATEWNTRAALQVDPVAVDECAAFEAWARPRWSTSPAEVFDLVPGRPDTEYNGNAVQAAWAGWQARAHTTTPPTALQADRAAALGIPLAAEYLELNRAVACKDWQAGWNACRENFLRATYPPTDWFGDKPTDEAPAKGFVVDDKMVEVALIAFMRSRELHARGQMRDALTAALTSQERPA